MTVTTKAGSDLRPGDTVDFHPFGTHTIDTLENARTCPIDPTHHMRTAKCRDGFTITIEDHQTYRVRP